MPRHKQETDEEYIKNRVVVTLAGCWEWQLSTGAYGYGVCFRNKRCWRAHRLAYTTFIGPIQDNLLICHKCDNRRCVNPDHLFLGTAHDNMQDMILKGRARVPTGDRHVASKLTDYQCSEVVRLNGTGQYSHRQLATMFGVCQATIWAITSGERRIDGGHSHTVALTAEIYDRIIMDRQESGLSCTKIAAKYGLSRRCVRSITEGRRKRPTETPTEQDSSQQA